MIKDVYIKDFAIISELKLDFENGFTVLTGETGAGKSIILGALRLLMGERADLKSIRGNADKCIIEANFSLNENVEKFLKSAKLDIYHTVLIRREISQSGRSRAFVNDTPVNLNDLKQLADLLLDINSQHQTINLQKGWFQLSVLDSVAKNQSLLKRYKGIYKEFSAKKKTLAEIIENERQQKADLDYLNFVFDEIDKLDYKIGEFEELESELKIVNNAELIKTSLFNGLEILQESDLNVQDSIDEVLQNFRNISEYSKELNDIYDRLKSVKIELKDLNSEISNQLSEVELDPEKQEYLENRMDEINRLSNKHSLQTADELIEKKNELEDKISEINSFSKSIESLEKEVSKLELELSEIAEKLSKNRKNAGKIIEKSIVKMLSDLGMENSSFIVNITENTEFNSNGKNNVEFLFSANKGIEAQEVSKVASGGELSRLMLSLKTLISDEQNDVSLIFDEIDSGLSGKIAAKVGDLLKSISKKRQLIVITHQAQIAGLGDSHFKVYKDHSSDTTNTFIKKLSQEQRVEELSEMLGGEKSESAVITAKELLGFV
jgi:DNA repair protein RecN (Recombination protein N)